jgi:hypothetical protein
MEPTFSTLRNERGMKKVKNKNTMEKPINAPNSLKMILSPIGCFIASSPRTLKFAF